MCRSSNISCHRQAWRRVYRALMPPICTTLRTVPLPLANAMPVRMEVDVPSSATGSNEAAPGAEAGRHTTYSLSTQEPLLDRTSPRSQERRSSPAPLQRQSRPLPAQSNTRTAPAAALRALHCRMVLTKSNSGWTRWKHGRRRLSTFKFQINGLISYFVLTSCLHPSASGRGSPLTNPHMVCELKRLGRGHAWAHGYVEVQCY